MISFSVFVPMSGKLECPPCLLLFGCPPCFLLFLCFLLSLPAFLPPFHFLCLSLSLFFPPSLSCCVCAYLSIPSSLISSLPSPPSLFKHAYQNVFLTPTGASSSSLSVLPTQAISLPLRMYVTVSSNTAKMGDHPRTHEKSALSYFSFSVLGTNAKTLLLCRQGKHRARTSR